MLKVRLMGTKNDIKWFSDMFPNKGTKKYYRTYAEVRKSNIKENQ